MTMIDGRRAKGALSRSAVMDAAVDLASVGGLEGLSIGGLAAEVSMSKGGIVALFGSKEQLQLATIAAAREIFIASVITPALEVKGGRARLEALIEGWLHYSESRVFAGGCFFAATSAELGAQPGPLRDAVAEAIVDWQAFIVRAVSQARDRGELPPTTDAEQLAFEISAMLDRANAMSLLFDSAAPYTQARAALRSLLVQSPA